MESHRRYKVAVLGSSRVTQDSPEAVKAFRIGQAVAGMGGILLTGGCDGLPYAADRGARVEGGFTVAISPAMNREEHASRYGYPLDSALTLYTGMGTKGRNVVLVRSSDACIFIGGGMGTLNEFTIAFDELTSACAIGILSNSGGFSEEFPRLVAALGRRPQAELIVESDPETLVREVFRCCGG